MVDQQATSSSRATCGSGCLRGADPFNKDPELAVLGMVRALVRMDRMMVKDDIEVGAGRTDDLMVRAWYRT